MTLLMLAVDAVQDKTVQRTLWEMLALVVMAIPTLAAVLVIVWKVAIKHHVEEFVRKQAEVHKSVTVNGGRNDPPTLRDDISNLRGQVQQLITQGGAIAQRTSDLGDRIDTVHELVTDTRDDLTRHIDSGERYLGQVQVVFKEHGIELPPSTGD